MPSDDLHDEPRYADELRETPESDDRSWKRIGYSLLKHATIIVLGLCFLGWFFWGFTTSTKNAPRAQERAYGEKRPTTDDVELLKELMTLLRPIQEAHRDESSLLEPAKDYYTRLAAIQADAEVAFEQVHKECETITNLPGDRTKRLREREAAISEWSEKKRREADEKLAQEHARRIEADAERERKRLGEERKEREARAKEELEGRRKELEHQQLIRDAHSRTVQELLAPFIGRSRWEVRDIMANRHQPSGVEPRPMSLSQLRFYRAFESSLDGQTTLAIIASCPRDTRRRWGIKPRRVWSVAEMTAVEQAQALLERLGPTLVEVGMLAP